MSEDIFPAAGVVIDNCTPECPCQSVHIELIDADGDAHATARVSPELARAVADALRGAADIAEARQRRIEGRLA